VNAAVAAMDRRRRRADRQGLSARRVHERAEPRRCAVSRAWHGCCSSRREAAHCALEDTTTMESILGIHEPALTFRAHRMEVLAANLANADTPHYKARDVEFSSLLNTSAVSLRTTNARHIETPPRGAQNELKYRIPHQPSLDGNTVESDLELARYAENAVSYQASLLFASSRISTLRTALSGARS
jgi:flagellar basal-body rod protein FlgB